MSEYESPPHEQRQADREHENTHQAIQMLDKLCPHLKKVRLKHHKPGLKRGSKRRSPFSSWRNNIEVHLL